jgi:hypothetical protein
MHPKFRILSILRKFPEQVSFFFVCGKRSLFSVFLIDDMEVKYVRIRFT